MELQDCAADGVTVDNIDFVNNVAIIEMFLGVGIIPYFVYFDFYNNKSKQRFPLSLWCKKFLKLSLQISANDFPFTGILKKV